MVQNESEADRASASKKMLALLEGLKRTSVGTVIYDQIARLVEEQESVQAKLDNTYASLLHLLLDAYARDPTADHITRINARLIQLRRSSAVPAGVSPGTVDDRIHKAASVVTSSAGGAVPEKPVPNSAGKRTTTAPVENAGTTAKTVKNAEVQADRRVNTAYRLHLDRQRNEIDKLQKTLAKSVTEAITQNREFGALLQIELRALQQAESDNEIAHMREILIGGLEELINGQNSLETKLHRTESYLKLIKDDSEQLHNELNKVRLLSLTDDFTGLPNRRAFMRRLQDEISRAQRYGLSLALAMIDLDEFKAINDIHGHAAGDLILQCYATEVLTVLRHHDMVARYGGEEFAVLLPNTKEEGAIAAINKVKNRARATNCEYQGNILPLPTFSTGIALYVPGESGTDLIDRTDRALYRAKRLGRNRTELELTISPPPGPPEGLSQDNGA